MAIQLDLATSQFGTAFAGAYFRVVSTTIKRDIDDVFSVAIDLSAYATSTPNDNTREVEFRRYIVLMADIEGQVGDSFLGKCYLWVMSQEDMTGSIAV